jgi:hypothetical protein
MTAPRIAFVCSCEDTMTLDGQALAKGCAAQGSEFAKLLNYVFNDNCVFLTH